MAVITITPEVPSPTETPITPATPTETPTSSCPPEKLQWKSVCDSISNGQYFIDPYSAYLYLEFNSSGQPKCALWNDTTCTCEINTDPISFGDPGSRGQCNPINSPYVWDALSVARDGDGNVTGVEGYPTRCGCNCSPSRREMCESPKQLYAEQGCACLCPPIDTANPILPSPPWIGRGGVSCGLSGDPGRIPEQPLTAAAAEQSQIQPPGAPPVYLQLTESSCRSLYQSACGRPNPWIGYDDERCDCACGLTGEECSENEFVDTSACSCICSLKDTDCKSTPTPEELEDGEVGGPNYKLNRAACKCECDQSKASSCGPNETWDAIGCKCVCAATPQKCRSKGVEPLPFPQCGCQECKSAEQCGVIGTTCQNAGGCPQLKVINGKLVQGGAEFCSCFCSDPVKICNDPSYRGIHRPAMDQFGCGCFCDFEATRRLCANTATTFVNERCDCVCDPALKSSCPEYKNSLNPLTCGCECDPFRKLECDKRKGEFEDNRCSCTCPGKKVETGTLKTCLCPKDANRPKVICASQTGEDADNCIGCKCPAGKVGWCVGPLGRGMPQSVLEETIHNYYAFHTFTCTCRDRLDVLRGLGSNMSPAPPNVRVSRRNTLQIELPEARGLTFESAGDVQYVVSIRKVGRWNQTSAVSLDKYAKLTTGKAVATVNTAAELFSVRVPARSKLFISYSIVSKIDGIKTRSSARVAVDLTSKKGDV